VITGLKERGVTIIYISHRLEEIFGIGDRVTVLKDGKYMGTRDVRDVTKSQLIRMMVGREMGEAFPARGTPAEETVLKVRGLKRTGVLDSVSFEVRAKEIVGLAGLVGSGRTALARAIFGSDPIDGGRVELRGKALDIRGPHDAVEAGIVLVPEDRKLEGLVEILSVRKNVGLPNLGLLQRWGFVHSRQEVAHVQEKIQQLDIRTYGPDQPALNLSGGNQQKVVLAKWLVSAPKVIILDEPTRGIDVGAKAEIYRLMRQLAETGAAVLMISSELPEILGMADRILVMHDGRLVAEFEGARATEEEILTAATGGVV
jgi:ABC-type sugar transport system ATPase subunit